ncbi:hypothetical protein CHI95_23085 [Providencia rettgeri]|uniref:Uncharacterized protein n=1 Tax=Providencia rettgeri TaxID=587 RepID=A0A264VLN4_PRORE|nr:hypothetical protein CHI95_23085 [Providencia rettgeri]
MDLVVDLIRILIKTALTLSTYQQDSYNKVPIRLKRSKEILLFWISLVPRGRERLVLMLVDFLLTLVEKKLMEVDFLLMLVDILMKQDDFIICYPPFVIFFISN